MQRNLLILFVFALVFLGGFLFFNKQSTVQENGEVATTTSQVEKAPAKISGGTKTTSAPPQSKNTGRVVFSVTDEAVGLDSLESILLTINEISVQKPGEGWVVVSQTPRTFDLLSLYRKAKNELFLDTNLNAGTYNQIRLSVEKIVITQKDGLKNVEAKLPSKVLRLNTKIVVEKGGISGVSFDFDSAKALHRSGDGTFLFFPVVKLNTQHGVRNVQILGGNVELSNGLTDFDQTLGVDESGVIKPGFVLDSATKIELLGNVIRIIGRDEKAEDIKVSAQSAIDTAVNGGYISSPRSVQTIIKEKKRVWQVVGLKGEILVSVYIDTTTGAVISVQ